jgi:aquaporin Z
MMPRYLAELVGTAILVLVGTLSILAAQAADAPLLVVVPLGFGLGLLAALYAVGEVSGGHFNPAVTLAAFLAGRIDVSSLAGYWIAQVLGAVLGSLGVWAVTDRASVARTVTTHTDALTGFVSEVLLTAVFVLVILAVTESATYRSTSFAAIALALAAVHFAGVPFSGASVNPARSLAPAIVGGEGPGLWVYLVAPLLGAVAAWGLHGLVHPRGEHAEQAP